MAALEKYLPRCRIFLLDGEKFRTNLFVFFFDLPLRRETATKTALLAEVLKRDHWHELAIRGEELYGALWDISVVKKGDRQLLLFSLETLKTVDTEDAVAFLKELLLGSLREGDFSEKMVERQKEILRRKLKSLQDDKKAFARKRIAEETAEGTAYGISGDGYEADLEEINAKGLFLFYRDLVEQAEGKFFFCGDRAEKKKVTSLRQEFPGKVLWEKKEKEKQPKNGPRFLQESAEMEQARLAMGFSVRGESIHRQAALLLFNHLLGGSPDSILFQQIREEKGLCYDVRSYLEPMSPYLYVQAGIRAEDGKETGKLVLQCMEQIKKEGIPEEKLQQAKEVMMRNYDGLSDSPWAMVDFFAEQALQGYPLTTERFLRQIEKMEAEDILREANHLELRVVYLLSGKEEKDGAE